MLHALLDRLFAQHPSGAGPVLTATAAEISWDHFSPNEQRRLAAKYLGASEREVSADGLAETAKWFDGLGLAQRLSLINAFFALGGGDGATPERRALWEQIARIIPGPWNSNIGEVSVIVELRDAKRFQQAGKAAGMRADWAWVRNKYHAGASFSLREWGVRASLNAANDTAAARAAGQGAGGGQLARVEFDAYGPRLGLLGLLRHKFGKIDAQMARWELAKRGLIPEPGYKVRGDSHRPESA